MNSQEKLPESQQIANMSGKNPETAVAQHKLIQRYQALMSRANKIGILLSYDDLGFRLSQAAGKWEPVRKKSLEDVVTFIEGAECAMLAQPRPMPQNT